MAKSLIRLCASLNTLSKTPKYFGSMRLCHSENEHKELTAVNNQTASEAKKLFDLFNSDRNPINLITNIEENKDKIDGRHVVVALTSMYKFYEMNKYPLENVISSPQFTKICNHLNRHIRTLEMSHIIQSLKILNLFRVKSSNTIVQNLLQLIRTSINDLHPNEIYYLTFLLKRMNPTHLGNAIYTALPEVFEARIKSKLDVEDIVELSNALKFASEHTEAKELIQFLVQKIDEYNGPIDTTVSIKIFRSICRINQLTSSYHKILFKIRDVLLQNVDNLNEVEVKLIILEICTQVLKGYDEFYNSLLLDMLINQIVKNNYGMEYGIQVLGKINRLNHIHLPLLQYLISKIQNNPYIFLKTPRTMIVFLHGLANSNFKPSNWESLRDIIFKNYVRLPDHVPMAYLALHIASLDDCNFDMIKHIFTMDQNLDRLKFDYHETLCELYQIVKTLYPEYTGPWPSDEILNSFKTLQFQYDPKSYPLLPALNKLLEDPVCIKTNVLTSLGHHIDHLVVLQDGSPIPIESNTMSEDSNFSCFVEDLNIPKDCLKVAICLVPMEMYGRNILQPNAKIRMKEKTLKAMSFKVVFIMKNTWISMPDMERIPYLRHIIGLKKKEPKDKNTEIDLGELIKVST
ncbi:uncharacterized protein LOC131674118 [Phymastichus coffea]|uniref:uncharacterized protein LOC131674118 n=1 Tax=Phymastichus coffea TaxID=108790 RepID=UPI00273B8F37|nr:uncharacterized protein LOC131674118 [Phymastichus coffea]